MDISRDKCEQSCTREGSTPVVSAIINNIHADRLLVYILLLLITIITVCLIWPYTGAVVLAIIVAIVLQPMPRWFLRRTGGRKIPATALTLLATLLRVVMPTLFGTWLVADALIDLSGDVSAAMRRKL